jgi:hypothetical protein
MDKFLLPLTLEEIMRHIYVLCFAIFLFEGCASNPMGSNDTSQPSPSPVVVRTDPPVISPSYTEHQAIKLLDGRILIVGGSVQGTPERGYAVLEMFPRRGLVINPTTGEVATTGLLNYRRHSTFTATLLTDLPSTLLK